MKNLKKLLFIPALAVVAFASSCKKDDGNDPSKTTVSISPTTANAASGESVNFSITATAATGGKLKKMVIVEQTSGTSGDVTLVDSTINVANIGHQFKYTVPAGSGDKTIKVTVTDDANATASASAKITVTGSSTLKDCGATALGNKNSTIGSFYNTSECKVYTVGEAKSNQGKVDIIYYHGDKNGPSISAPDDAGVQDFTTYQLNTWTTKNSTRFVKAAGSFDFAAATVASIKAAYEAGTPSSAATGITTNGVILFKTVGGRFGAVKIGAISGTSSTAGTVGIQVKVQE